jgi:hypothetical protein
MAQNPFDDQTLTLAFPTVTISSMPAASGGRAAKLGDDEQARVEAIQNSGPWGLAAGLAYDDIIDPRELRNAFLAALGLCEARLEGAAPSPDGT